MARDRASSQEAQLPKAPLPVLTPGLRLPRHRATTRHLAAIYPFQAERGLGACGTYLGTNVTAGDEAWCFDPFELYRKGVITSPNVMVFGQVGAGKSAAVKTFLYRSVGVLGSPNGQRRWCGIIDPKGEYGRLAQALGLTVIKLYPGGPTKLNPLDPGPTVERDTADQRHAARVALLAALFVRTLGRSLTPVEDAAIAAVLESFDRVGATPTLRDVGACLADPTDHMRQALRTESDQLARELRDLSLGNGRLLSGDLRGMFDQVSTERIDWNGPGVVIDVSAVLHDDHQLGLVMLCATAWLQALIASPTGSGSVRHRYLVSDEDWAVLRDPVTARFKQASFKLSRTYGVCNIGITHRIADLRSQADDGTSTAKIAMGLLADTQTRIVFQQPDDQIDETTKFLGLTPLEAAIAPRLTKGRAIWRVANQAAIVQHSIHPTEQWICDTDANLTGLSSRSQPPTDITTS